MSQLNFDLSTFHDYDVRDIYPDKINEDFFYHLGKSIALFIEEGPIAVGYDIRTSSSSLSDSLIEGITNYGLDVVCHGQISTEMHYYSAGKYQYPANVMITASHNPGEYNGAKIVQKGMIALNGSYGLPKIKELMNKSVDKASRKGTITEQDIFEGFVQNALSFVDVQGLSPLKVVVDAGNGAGGPVWNYLKGKIPVTIVPLYLEPNGAFPNHLADPLDDNNVQDLIAKVKEEKADLGIALDGDADRAFFVDETGTKLSGTVSTALFAEYLLREDKGAILFPATIGRVVAETVTKNGGIPVKTRVGHSIIKEKMKEHNGIFGGEHSGHFYFRKNFMAESSLLASLLLFDIMTKYSQKLSEIRTKYDIYPQSGEINFVVKDRDKMIQLLKTQYEKDASSIEEMEGYSFFFDTYWFNVRLSKTEPLLRLNIEADDAKTLDTKTKEIVGYIEEKGGERK